MRLKEGVVINNIDDQFVAVDVRNVTERFNGMIKMNKTAGDVAQLLEKEITLEEIVGALTEKYEVSSDEARQNAEKVIDEFKKLGLLEE